MSERDSTPGSGRGSGDAPSPPAPVERGAASGAAELLLAVVERQSAALRRHEAAARDGSDEEAVHDMRVACRRLRAALRVFRSALPARRTARVRRGLRRLGRSLGRVRDLEVQRSALAALAEEADERQDRAALEHVALALDADLERARRRLRRRLDKLDVERQVRLTRELARGVPLDAGVPSAPQAAVAPLIRRAFGGLEDLRDHEQPDALHRMRVRVKRLRYAIELLQPALTPAVSEVLHRLRGLQDALGRHHDMLVLEERLLGALRALTRGGRSTLADGLLNPIEILRSERYRAYEAFLKLTEGLSVESVSRLL